MILFIAGLMDLMGLILISGVCTTTNISTQQDGAKRTASTFNHLHRASVSFNIPFSNSIIHIIISKGKQYQGVWDAKLYGIR